MLEDLEGGNVAVRREAMLELGVILFVQGVAQIVNDAAEETLTDEPRLSDGFPFLFHSLARVGGRQVCDGRIVGRWLRWGGVGVDAGEVVVVVESDDVRKETVLVCCISAPRVGDVFYLAC
mgnify:CR=1 FL=1